MHVLLLLREWEREKREWERTDEELLLPKYYLYLLFIAFRANPAFFLWLEDWVQSGEEWNSPALRSLFHLSLLSAGLTFHLPRHSVIIMSMDFFSFLHQLWQEDGPATAEDPSLFLKHLPNRNFNVNCEKAAWGKDLWWTEITVVLWWKKPLILPSGSNWQRMTKNRSLENCWTLHMDN